MSKPKPGFEPIAIIGEGCILPEAPTPEALWQLVSEAKVVVSQPDETVGWGLQRPGGFVRGSAAGLAGLEFKHSGGAVPFSELDVLFHWAVYAARNALQSSHYAASPVLQRTGLIMGNLSFPTRQFGRFAEHVVFQPWEQHRRAPAAAVHPANRFMSGFPPLVVAQTLGLGGCAFALDAACASSLYALKLACDQLHRRDADLMLAGGVAAADPIFLEDGFVTLRALSEHGVCRPFSSEADGLLPCEGAAFVVLKRLADAVRDGDEILGVVRGIGLSNSGRAGGFLASSREGQIRCLNNALEQAQVNPEAISYVECHATGTPVGDVAELRSLLHVFGSERPLPIGSIKANIGHPITAAGMAGLLKVLHAFKHRAIPPTPNARPLLKILGRVGLAVPETLSDWKTSGPRLAGLSGFGFGGNNAHVVLQAWNQDAHVFPTLRQPEADGPIAIVAAEVFTTRARTTQEFVDALITGQLPQRQTEDDGSVAFDPRETVFPPLDLRHTLPQQLVILDLVNKALRTVGALDTESSGVFVGMGVDGETNRYSLRHRLESILQQYQFTLDERVKSELAEDITPKLIPATVVGSLSNIPANRVNVQHNLRGQGFTVSCEELSGDHALTIAAKALRAGELTTAIVGGIDLGAEIVHGSALRELGWGDDLAPANGAVVLVLQTLETARRAGNRVLAIIDGDGPAVDPDFELAGHPSLVSRLFGHAHAAAGLLNLGAAALLLARRSLPFGSREAMILEPRAVCARVHNRSIFGPTMTWTLKSVVEPELLLARLPRSCTITTFSASSVPALIQRLKGDTAVPPGPRRLAIVDDPDHLPARCDEAAELLAAGNKASGWLASQTVFHEACASNKVAFVYTGAAAAYREMGRSLMRELPFLWAAVGKRAPELVRLAGWLARADAAQPPSSLDQFIGSTLLAQVHNEFTRGFLKLVPDAVMGVSSGETNAIMAAGLWPDIDGLLGDLRRLKVFEHQIAGDFQAVRAAWNRPRVAWENWVIVHDVAEVKRWVAGQERVYVTIVYTDRHCVVSGEPEACRRVIEAVGKECAIPQTFEAAAHCLAVAPLAGEWEKIHTRETAAMAGHTAVYSNNTNATYVPTSSQIGRELTGQFLKTVELPKTVRQAWDDGIRVFVEHGPRDTLSKAIGTILQGKPQLCISLDVFGACSVLQAAKAAAELWCIGAHVDISRFSPPTHPSSGKLHYPIRWKPISVSDLPILELAGDSFVMAPPRLNFLAGNDEEDEGVPRPPAGHPILRLFEQACAAHAAYLDHQMQCHRRFQEFLRSALAPGRPRLPAPAGVDGETNAAANNPKTPGAAVVAPMFNRKDLIGLASGKISDYFGPRFQQQDAYPIQVRMPEPPLLLCDRVTRIEGEPGVLGAATIWTETDVRHDWYLHDGRMVPCAVIEAGQADLLLISWLGIDFENKGQRAYRLLGSHITFHRELPRPGDTLKFEIRITGHARQGDVRIFFFDYDCRVNGDLLITARRGHAGFFTKDELKQSKGVLWNPAEAKYSPGDAPDLPGVYTQKQSFSNADIQAFAAGNLAACFGDNLVASRKQVQPPRIQAGQHTFIGEVPELNFTGGPVGRGYARAVTRIDPGAWYFTGHFRNDPCMPGTLMAEGCMQLMSFYLAAAGMTVDHDGWRFEPLPGKTFPFWCRGQVIPSSRELVFELFVDELKCDPWPRLRAHALATVDGIKALLCEGLEVRLVPEVPVALAAAKDGRGQNTIAVASKVEVNNVRTPGNPPLKRILQQVKSCQYGGIQVGVAQTEAEVESCHKVVEAVFVEELGQTLDDRYLPDSIFVFSRDASRVFGTISLTASGSLGLPVERSVPLPVGYSRENTVQFSKLAILKSYRRKQNLQFFIGEFAIGLLRDVQELGYRCIILESILSPMHQAFYQMLGLKIIGEPYRYVGWPDRPEPNHLLMGNTIGDCLAGFQANFPKGALIDPRPRELGPTV